MMKIDKRESEIESALEQFVHVILEHEKTAGYTLVGSSASALAFPFSLCLR